MVDNQLLRYVGKTTRGPLHKSNKHMCIVRKQVWAEGERMEEMNSHSTVGGIRDIIEYEVVIELGSDDVVALLPGAGVTRGGQSQRNQACESETHLI